MTYLELLVVVTLLIAVSALVLPTAQTVRRSKQERELRRALEDIRRAIDTYHCDWIRGCVEAEDEQGWPRTLDDLTTEQEFAANEPQCATPCLSDIEKPAPSSGAPPAGNDEAAEETKIVYLRHLPRDPFADPEDEHDTGGWNARAYGDDPDDTGWGGENVYDVRSSSDLRALDGTEYSTW